MAIITDRTLHAKSNNKDVWLTDPAPKGHGRFCARITKAGGRLFYFKYTASSGKREYVPLGGYDSEGIDGLTLKEARIKAGELSILYQSGIVNIKGYLEEQQQLQKVQKAAEQARLEAEHREAEARLTVKGLFEKWQTQRLSKYKDGGKEISRLFNKDILPVIGHLPADIIRKGHIIGITDDIEKRGANRMAKVAFTSMRQMFLFSLERDFIEIDPTATLRKSSIGGKDVERDRVLSDDEIELLAKQVKDSSLLPTTQAAIWIVLSTCCRIGELLQARWEHVDFEKKVWTIPAKHSKNGLLLDIYLSDFAVQHFETIQSINHGSLWLFPNRGGTNHVNTKTITKQLGDRQRTTPMSNRSKKADALRLPGGKWTPHDLRRTGSTLMAALGIKPEVIDKCQNHKETNKIRRIYQRYSYVPEMRQAWKLLGERLENLTSGDRGAKLLPFRKIHL